MLASIHPLGERARDRRWGVTVGAYVVASTAAAALLGAVLGGVGAVLPLTPGVLAALVLAAGALALAADLGAFTLPTIHRQVDKDWLDRYRGWVVGLGFGFQLGLGVVTIVNTAAVYLALVLALLTGSVAGGAVVGTTFGLVRAPVRRPDQLRLALRRMHGWRAVSQRAGIAVQALVLAGAGAVALAH
jgi:sulfite exporter TauE/SafE